MSRKPKPYKPVENNEPKVVDWYLTDMEHQKIENVNYRNWIYLVIKTQNLKGEKITINLHNPEVDCLLNGKERLKKDVLRDYPICNDEEQIKLKIIKQLKRKKDNANS